MTYFIKKKDAMIVWNVDRDDHDFITEFYVYEWTIEQRKGYFKGESTVPIKYKNCSFSTGNCCFDFWNGMDKEDLICYCLKIFLEYKTDNLKKCLLELGKIDELESIRKMVYNMFCEYKDYMSYKEFIEQEYGF